MKAFGELTIEEQNALFQAWLKDRDCIEFLEFPVNAWVACDPIWSPCLAYRVRSEK